MDKKILILGSMGVSLVSVAVGAVAGYKYAKKKLWDEFSERLESELLETKRFYNTLYKEGDFKTPEEAVKKLIPPGLRADETFDNTSVSTETLERIVDGLKYKVAEKPAKIDYNHIAATRGEDQPVVQTNIFNQIREEHHLPENFNEEESRELDVPYIIPVDVYMRGEAGFPNLTFTFFTEDRVLVDDADNLIGTSTEKGDYIDDLIGMENFQFGHLSKDANVVYVRNNKTGYDYEILRCEGSYAQVVAGMAETSG